MAVRLIWLNFYVTRKNGQSIKKEKTERCDMKGTNPTKAEKELWNRIASIGCIACLQDGIKNTHVSIHHIDGRTKPGAHKKVLPLCAPHHQQDDADPMQRVAVHPNKARFETQYGTQIELLHQVMLLIGVQP